MRAHQELLMGFSSYSICFGWHSNQPLSDDLPLGQDLSTSSLQSVQLTLTSHPLGFSLDKSLWHVLGDFGISIVSYGEWGPLKNACMFVKISVHAMVTMKFLPDLVIEQYAVPLLMQFPAEHGWQVSAARICTFSNCISICT